MKKRFIIPSLFAFICYVSLDANFGFLFVCTELTQKLVCEEKNSLDPHDLLYALNWLESGYQRSMGTIRSQEAAIDILKSSWHSWQIITHRRRNPSKSAPNGESCAHLCPDAQKAHTELEQYQNTLDEYDFLSTKIFNSLCIKNETINSFLNAIKAESRIQITASLIDIQSIIQECSSLNWIFKGRSRLELDTEMDLEEIKIEQPTSRSLLNSIREKLPGFAFDSFVRADINYVKASDAHWAILYNTQLASTSVWKTIETARSRVFFQAYELLYNTACLLGIQPIKLTVFASNNDQIESIRLPHPDTLKSFEKPSTIRNN